MIDSRQEIDLEIYQRRVELRELYDNPKGKAELVRMIKRNGLLSALPCEPEAVALHNEAVRRLEEAGLLDEECVETLVDTMFKQPISVKGLAINTEED